MARASALKYENERDRYGVAALYPVGPIGELSADQHSVVDKEPNAPADIVVTNVPRQIPATIAYTIFSAQSAEAELLAKYVYRNIVLPASGLSAVDPFEYNSPPRPRTKMTVKVKSGGRAQAPRFED
jgi:hypothetical protein